MTGVTVGRWLLAPLMALLLAGCFQSDEERAVDAYDSRDFETAAALATDMAEAGNPRGLELLALMAAQGLGREIDFNDAIALIDRAIAIDPGYGATRDSLLAMITAMGERAAAAFEDQRYEVAYRLARPVAAYGDDAAARLIDTMIGGQYVALDGSDMPWRSFWTECSGNVRLDDPEATARRFEEQCAGKRVVWDGEVVRARGDVVHVRMAPGRTRAQADILLSFAEGLAPDRDMIQRGRKIRFTGTVAERGDFDRPDGLNDGEILGDAP